MVNRKKYLSCTSAAPLALTACGCIGVKKTDDLCASSKEELSNRIQTQKTEEEWSKDGGYAYYHYQQLGRDVMPIGAWVAPPSEWGSYTTNKITKNNYRMVAESGLNSIYALYENAETCLQRILDALDYCEELGLVYLARDNRILEAGKKPEWMERFAIYQSKSAYGGNLVVDEPGAVLFDKLSALRKTWTTCERTKEKLMYVNLLPTYATDAQLINGVAGGERTGSLTYIEYLRAYVETVHPQILSFDFYPFNGLHADYFEKGYFQQLHIIKKCAANAGIPFWTFVQAGYFQTGNLRTMPQGEFFWQVNTALAYGAKGIQYFCYWSPYEFGHDGCALIGMDGQKTYLYEYAVQANKQIAAVDDVLMKSANVGVIQVGDSPDEIPEEDKLLAFRELKSATGSDAIIGCFDYRGKTALYVVSNNYKTGGDMVLHFSSSVHVRMIQDGRTTNKINDALTLSLTAGEGVLIVLE